MIILVPTGKIETVDLTSLDTIYTKTCVNQKRSLIRDYYAKVDM